MDTYTLPQHGGPRNHRGSRLPGGADHRLHLSSVGASSAREQGLSKSVSMCSLDEASAGLDGPGLEPEEILQLTHEARQLSDTLARLRQAALCPGVGPDLDGGGRVYRQLGDVLSVLKPVLKRYPALHSVGLLTAIGSLIATVKGHCPNEQDSRSNRLLEQAIDGLAMAFSSVMSEFLMGEVDTRTLHSARQVRSLSVDNLLFDGVSSENRTSSVQSFHKSEPAKSQDRELLDGTVEASLSYLKAWSEYSKGLLAYMERRLNLEVEHANTLLMVNQTLSPVFMNKQWMPVVPILSEVLKKENEAAENTTRNTGKPFTSTLLQPLAAQRVTLKTKRKEINEQWHRGLDQYRNAESCLRIAELQRAQREEDLALVSTGNLGNSLKTTDKRQHVHEEAQRKLLEAEVLCRTNAAEAWHQRDKLVTLKGRLLAVLNQLLQKADAALQEVVVRYLEVVYSRDPLLPTSACGETRMYRPGHMYVVYMQSVHGALGHAPRKTLGHSKSEELSIGSQWNVPMGVLQSPSLTEELPSLQLSPGDSSSTGLADLIGPQNCWSLSQIRSSSSDSESADAVSSSLDSPCTSPGDIKRKLSRTPSTGTMSSLDDLEDKDLSSFDKDLNPLSTSMPVVVSGPFKKTDLSVAARTHRLRRLRALSRCRECDAYIYFQGAECEECFLVCHRKCLQTLLIRCGRQRLGVRAAMFGEELLAVTRSEPHGIPIVVRTCIAEMERRALCVKGLYRVNGLKTQVDRLCAAFENGRELVELSEQPVHVISNVLKHFLRRMPEPIVPFQLYGAFLDLARESLLLGDEAFPQSGLETLEICHTAPAFQHTELGRILSKLQDLLKQLPSPHYNTLSYIIQHLHRVTDREEENKMSFRNLGIVFGPTLLRPCSMKGSSDLCSLVDYPIQSHVVEMLIFWHKKLFSEISYVVSTDDCGPSVREEPSAANPVKFDKTLKSAAGNNDMPPCVNVEHAKCSEVLGCRAECVAECGCLPRLCAAAGLEWDLHERPCAENIGHSQYCSSRSSSQEEGHDPFCFVMAGSDQLTSNSTTVPGAVAASVDVKNTGNTVAVDFKEFPRLIRGTGSAVPRRRPPVRPHSRPTKLRDVIHAAAGVTSADYAPQMEHSHTWLPDSRGPDSETICRSSKNQPVMASVSDEQKCCVGKNYVIVHENNHGRPHEETQLTRSLCTQEMFYQPSSLTNSTVFSTNASQLSISSKYHPPPTAISPCLNDNLNNSNASQLKKSDTSVLLSLPLGKPELQADEDRQPEFV
ncbi:rho GTPase-activating protein 45-like isoform X1 [Petromyzon marinus]|uniref:rho GTPase-activating protein 45-like isoform X1 n=1 Tax=Petromyzon marinus TaxID=7757 RepID=UPI003F710420